MRTPTTKAKGVRLFVLALGIALMSTIAQAGVLYNTGFESGEGFSSGDINGQNGWVAGTGRGSVVADGGNWVLDVPMSADVQGGSVSRINTNASQRYLVIEMDFKIVGDGRSRWFMDNDDGGIVLASLGWETGANTDSRPGGAQMRWTAGKWYHLGMEVDQTTGLVTAVNHDGVWIAEDDTVGVSGALDRFVFRGNSKGGGGHLYIDNLSVTESDTRVPVVPEPTGMAALAIGVVGLVGFMIRRRSA